MSNPLITLTTDFGDASPYVAVMKGVIHTVHPAARVLDLTHRIRPQNLRHAHYFLTTAVPYFPPGTIHVCVIDPGVGSDRVALYAEAGGQRVVGPDNGILSGVLRHADPPAVRRLENPRYWREAVSRTFHGRDVFAPVAAHLARGADPADLGPEAVDWVDLKTRSFVCYGRSCSGEVLHVDDFGNVITNVPCGWVKSLPARVTVGGAPPHTPRWVRTYADAAPGELVSLFSSDGFFELAEVNGNAAARLGVSAGTPVELHLE
jgi:S-adenosylmethionine hydrolase